MQMLMGRSNSTPSQPAGQCSNCKLATQGALFVLLISVLGLVGIGCRSIYPQTRAIYPAGACERLKLRMDETDRAGQSADRAISILRDQLAKGHAGQNMAPDVDRLEMTALDFARCVAAVRDAEANCDQPARFAAEIQRLQQRSKQLLDTTRSIRNSGGIPTVSQLEELLRRSSPP